MESENTSGIELQICRNKQAPDEYEKIKATKACIVLFLTINCPSVC